MFRNYFKFIINNSGAIYIKKTNFILQNTHKELFMRKEMNQANQVSIDSRKCKELEQRLYDEQARHQKLTNGW